MKTSNLWKLHISYPNGSRVTRIKRAETLRVGSGYGADVVLSHIYPRLLVEVDDQGQAKGDPQAKIEKSFSGVICRYQDGLSIEIENITEARHPLHFSVQRASASPVSDEWTIWHYVGNVLLETETIVASVDHAKTGFLRMRSGIETQWQQMESRLVVKLPSGEIKSLKAEASENSVYIAHNDKDTYVLCRSGGKDTYEFQPKDFETHRDPFNKYFIAFLATWFLLIGLLNFSSAWLTPPDADLIAQEELPELMKKVEIAKAEIKKGKEGQGGNRQVGGGGVATNNNDARGGGGFVSDEVVVADLQSLSGGSGVFDALGALDKQMAAQGAKTASLGPSNATANSILGALGALGGGSKQGGGGLGLGGVGTKGFGGGGGGGSGTGFGKGTGAGLGAGNGPRNLSFETGDSDVRGGLDRSEVDAVVRQNLAQIRFCYNRGLRSHPDLSGRVTSHFVIGSDGRVKTSNIKQSSLGVGSVEDCIKDKVAAWSFPKPRGGGEVTVNYPFLLRAN